MTQEFSPQLPLPLQPRDTLNFGNFFVTDSNRQVVQQLQQFLRDNEWFFYLWANTPAVGLSHLLQASCELVSEQQQSVFYFSLCDIAQHSPLLLQSIEHCQLVCLDNIEAITGNAAWQEAVFHLYNKLKDQGNKLIVSANTSPTGLDLSLADLHSRLQAGLIYQLPHLDDVEKQQALQWRAKQRGMIISDEVMAFLWKHWSRDMGALLAMLQRLDEMSLVAKRRITIPFIKQVLEL